MSDIVIACCIKNDAAPGDGLPIAVQVRKALESWVKARGVKVKPERKRVTARKRP